MSDALGIENYTMTTPQAWAKGSEPENRWTDGHDGLVFENSDGRRAIVGASGAFHVCADGSERTPIIVPCVRSTSWRVYSEPEPPEPEPPEPEIIEVTVGGVVCEACPIKPRDGLLTYDDRHEEDGWTYLDFALRKPRCVGIAFKREGIQIAPARDVLFTLGGFRSDLNYMEAACRVDSEREAPTHVLMERELPCDTD